MSMEHKAFIFDYDEYFTELNLILTNSLLNQETEYLLKFIEQNLENIVDPDEGEPLECLWKTNLKKEDVHVVGDFALTKFYDPAEDIGLGYEWSNIEQVLNENFLSEFSSIILGKCIGFTDNYFDPGKIGSYLQSPNQVKNNLKLIHKCVKQKPELSVIVKNLTIMFQEAQKLQKGLYITF